MAFTNWRKSVDDAAFILKEDGARLLLESGARMVLTHDPAWHKVGIVGFLEWEEDGYLLLEDGSRLKIGGPIVYNT